MTLQNSNIDLKNNKKLSVQVTLSGLSFLVTNLITKELVYFSEKILPQTTTPEELLIILQNSFSETLELQGLFNEVVIIYATELYSIVPTSLFEESKASEYLKFNSKILANDFIAFDQLENNDITIVYIPFVNINNYLFDRFGHFNYYHSNTLLLKYLLKKDKHYSLPKVYINVYVNSFDIIVINNGKLSLCNSYTYKTPEDFIYYILFCLEQLKLNPDTIDLVLSGLIEKNNDNYNILFNYVRNVSFSTYKKELILNTSESKSVHRNLILKLVD
ncbi:MAG: DUF3822 family protein [Flavobacteriaceae bacterium]